MALPQRRIAFVLASTNHGTMILNRFDYKMTGPNAGYGVGFNLLNNSEFDMNETRVVAALLDARRRHFGDGVRVLDLGANIGVFTVEWARHMAGWGTVLTVEAQERVFYALAGNIAINNCFNARPIWAAVTSQPGTMRVPVLDHFAPTSFGSLELRQRPQTEEIGQPVEYREDRLTTITAVSVDGFGLPRLDLMKVDVEGMELEVLEGARRTIGQFHPILVVENLKADKTALNRYLDEYGYRQFVLGLNIVAIHPSDPTTQLLSTRPASPP
jgi:FkbM family methyltransferase